MMNPSPLERKKPLPEEAKSQWHLWIWYLVAMLAVLWMWQQTYEQAAVHTIPYSQFKQYLRNGEVVECAIGENNVIARSNCKPKPDKRRTHLPIKPETPTSRRKQNPRRKISPSRQKTRGDD